MTSRPILFSVYYRVTLVRYLYTAQCKSAMHSTYIVRKYRCELQNVLGVLFKKGAGYLSRG